MIDIFKYNYINYETGVLKSVIYIYMYMSYKTNKGIHVRDSVLMS